MPKYQKLVFIDLETTGANPMVDRITEIGLVEVTNGQVQRWSTLVNPDTPIPPFIQNLTGITDAMVENAPRFDEVVAELRRRLEGALFIAHNARFDYGFLRNAFKARDIALRCEVLCTVKLSRKLFPQHPKHNLDASVERHGLVAEARHRALADADLLWQFWNRIQQDVPPEVLEETLNKLLQRPSAPSNLPLEVLDDIPEEPGVYIFYGENGAPLYVGKSIHLRQRVLSHFNAGHRLYQDMRISHQIHRLEWRQTAGEVGALLLEAQLIKELQPIHNRMLRRQRELCAWQLQPTPTGGLQPVLSFAVDCDFGRTDRLFGLFRSKRKVDEALLEIAEKHQLCLVMLGLENRVQAGKPCFAHQLHRCRGACVGKESEALHQARLEAALSSLKLVSWPHAGPVGLIEVGKDGNRDVHVIDNWCWLGTAKSEDELWNLLHQAPARPAFDMDTYKILIRALDKRQVKVQRLARDVAHAA